MTDMLTRKDVTVGRDAVASFYMHVQNIPARLFVPIVIQILDHLAILGAYDPSVRHGDHPCLAGHTTSRLARRSKINRSPGRPRIPATMWAAGKGPGRIGLERQLHWRLGQVWGQQGFDTQIKRRPKELDIGGKESQVADIIIPERTIIEKGKKILHAGCPGINGWIKRHIGPLAEGESRKCIDAPQIIA